MNEQELKYQVGEAWKGTYNAVTTYGNANVVQDPTGLSVYRSLKPGNVGHPLTDTAWWFLIIDMSSIKTESDCIKALNDAIAADEAQRVANEQNREQAEQGRVNAENARVEAEQGRVSAEQQRVQNEQTRQNQEQTRVSQEQSRVTAEQGRVTAEQGRVTAEQLRVQAENQRAVNEENRVATEQQRVANEQTRISQEQARQQSEAERQATFVQSQQARREAFVEAEAQRQATFVQNEQQRDAEAAALQTKLENGEVIPALAKDIESWRNSNSKVIDTQTDAVFTAGGNESVNSNEAARIISLVPGSLTAGAASLVSTGFNLLRNATQIGSGQVWYFPVPYLRYGTFGTADENNGVLFTDSDNSNITPTVYWKALSDGVPTSATDGVAAGYTDSNGYRFFTTPAGHEGEVGYFIVQATRATTCAHIAWSGRYDEYIAIDNASDAGASLALTTILNNLHSNGLMYNVGDVVDSIAFTTTSAVWTRNCDRKQGSDLEWTNTLQEEEGTYLHTATIADMKEDGAMVCTNEGIAFVVSGKEVSYTDSNATAFTTDYIYYELATPVTGTESGTFSFIIEDWGVIYFTGVTGTVVSIIEYSQNIVDTLRKLATTGLNDAMRVIAESLNQLAAENERLKIYAERLEARIEALESNA